MQEPWGSWWEKPAVGSATIRKSQYCKRATESTRAIKTCDDLFHTEQTGRRDEAGTHTCTHICIDVGERMRCGVMDAHGGCPHYCSGRAIFSNLGSA